MRSRYRQAVFGLWSVLLAVLLKATACSRAYPLGCSCQGKSYYDFDNYPFPPPGVPVKSTDDYQLVERLGTGKFSDVFSAVEVGKDKFVARGNRQELDPSCLVVIKCLKPVTDRKIRRELLVLSHVSKLPNLARLLAVVLHPDYYEAQRTSTMLPRMPSLVLKHAGHNTQWLCHPTRTTKGHNTPKEDGIDYLSEYEIKYFLLHLLVALDALHSKGIMHRDCKPRNVLISRKWGSSMYPPLSPSENGEGPLMLIDLGLADFYLPNTRYNVRVASRHFKSPELLIGYQYYNYCVDLWPVGCILAGLLFRREPFFRGKDNVDQLKKIVSVLGTPDLVAYISRLEFEVSPDVRRIINKCASQERSRYDGAGKSRVPWLSFRAAGTPIPSLESLDLLDKLLVYDHDARLTAQEAMAHPFFDAVRDRVKREVMTLQSSMNSFY